MLTQLEREGEAGGGRCKGVGLLYGSHVLRMGVWMLSHVRNFCRWNNIFMWIPFEKIHLEILIGFMQDIRTLQTIVFGKYQAELKFGFSSFSSSLS